VLVLAYMFPPLGGGGVYRTLKHVKYLPRHGYESIVVTTSGRWYPPRDSSLLAEVPAGTRVVAAPELPVARLRALATNPLHRLGLPRALAFFGWPDAYGGWVPGAVWSALRAVRRLRPTVVYSTSPPVSAHLVGLIVRRLTGLPWVADFRDTWTLADDEQLSPRLLARLSARLEEAVVKRADRLVVADESVELLGVDPHNRTLILNGVDPEDLPSTVAATAGPRLRVAYVGTLYGARDAEPAFAAMEKLISDGRLERARLQVRMVGSDFRGPAEGSALDSLPVEWTGYVDHHRAVTEMTAADVLLLYQPPGWDGASGKLYEYLATGRPILCVAPAESRATRLVAELGAGECARPNDPTEIENAVASLYGRWRNGELGVNDEVRRIAVERYSRDALAARLADVLDDAVDEAMA
jgi:glycosyltransferase involved in cell wall biosynthesis